MGDSWTSPRVTITEQFAYVVQYSHKHGNDLSVYKTQEDQVHAAVHIVREWMGDLDEEDQAKINKLIEAKDWSAVLTTYEEATGHSESIELVDTRIITDVPEPKL